MANDIKQFEAELNEALKETIEKAELVIAKVAFDGVQKIAEETPFDTGRAMANWQVQINKPNESEIEIPESGISKSQAVNMAVNQCQEAMSKFKLNDVVNIFNNVEYMIPLEYGSSRQAPKGWVMQNSQIMENKLDEALKKI